MLLIKDLGKAAAARDDISKEHLSYVRVNGRFAEACDGHILVRLYRAEKGKRGKDVFIDPTHRVLKDVPPEALSIPDGKDKLLIEPVGEIGKNASWELIGVEVPYDKEAGEGYPDTDRLIKRDFGLRSGPKVGAVCILGLPVLKRLVDILSKATDEVTLYIPKDRSKGIRFATVTRDGQDLIGLIMPVRGEPHPWPKAKEF